MQFKLTQEFINDLRYCNELACKIQNLVAYMQPRMCSMITIPVKVEFDTSFQQENNKGRIMASMCFGVMKVNFQSIKNYMGRAFYKDDCIVYLSFLIGHELSHSDQYVNHNLYGKDDHHTWYVESSATFNSIQFLTEHSEDIADILGMDRDRYYNILNYVAKVEFESNYQFSNICINETTLIERYIDMADRRMVPEIRDAFINALSFTSNVLMEVYYVNNIDDFIDDEIIDLIKIAPSIMGRCIIKRDGQIKPVDYDIINTIDYIDGFRGFIIDNCEYLWYTTTVYDKETDSIKFAIIREVPSSLNKQNGFWKG